ncbi:3-hydroxyisobutyrate dehydrogenase-like beta-hydroxyacid dehydrogenase [Saccharothrix carnea]|uniref:3-hydroxyisobutyrate dehydrogenase-like beta-hydroxyacid dehydrogenase n=1 Tax=Saccharothrix carnea TaxID=1280637 RepID=A0A2P8HLL6_SACCR|nr:NAD(P)-binding domain-containing protein [Saccharothrix carnea]PSL47113.1 3-hydroxyisobutyrate dehydrogenase-like beta-hydroxyacid dehydrogenase [Saccharothrix carnea]
MGVGKPVAVVGLGLMGQALAGAFVRAGYPTTVWNRTPGKAGRLVAEGAAVADSFEQAVAAASVVVVCVADHDVVRGLLRSVGGGLEGKVLVNLTSATSAQMREISGLRGVGGYLAGAIMGMPQGIGTAESLTLYSGPRSVFEVHEEVLRVLGEAVYLGADHGLSSLYAGAGVSLMWSVLNGFLQGVALLEAAGVRASAFVPFARQNIATTADWLAGYAEQIDEGAYPGVDATIDSHAAAMGYLIRESEANGVNAELPRFVRGLAERAVAEGRGRDGYAAMIELFRRP